LHSLLLFITFTSVDKLLLSNRQHFLARERYKQAEKKTNDTMTKKFLLHKDKEEKDKPPHI
jgi:hypothetical protein